jgi:integrase
MTDFTSQVRDYLQLRRSLGFKLEYPGYVLEAFAAHLETIGATTLTTELAIAWAGSRAGVQPVHLAHRLGAIRGFARYLRTIDPETEVPPPGIWQSRVTRAVPHLYSDDEVRRLVDAARHLRPPLRAATYEALFGLLAVSGMRVGEALHLTRNDVDLDRAVLTVQHGKFDRSRLIPLHPTAVTALARYAARRDQLCRAPNATTFFTSTVGTPLDSRCVHRTFKQLAAMTGLGSGMRPRIHDLRHRFAVRSLIDMHKSGAGVRVPMAVLSHYLGHAHPAGTYWYLTATPELMELAAAHVGRRLGEQP